MRVHSSNFGPCPDRAQGRPKTKRGAVAAPRFPAAEQVRRYLPFAAFAFGAAFAGAAAVFGAGFAAGLEAAAGFLAAGMVLPLAFHH
jgi:hypothetical protein